MVVSTVGSARESVKYRRVREIIRGTIRFDEPMRQHTSFGIGGSCDVWVRPSDLSDLERLLGYCQDEQIPVTAVGKGTNLLVMDRGIRGVVVNLEDCCRDVLIDGTRVAVGGGVALGWLVGHLASRGHSGWEFAAGIPGTVGGAVATNAGIPGHSFSDKLLSVTVLGTDGLRELRVEDISFSYRKSDVTRFGIVLKAELSLEHVSEAAAREKVRDHLSYRRRFQPVGTKCAGCIFRNLPGKPVGAIIDSLGFKGYTLGGAQVSPVHANFIVNLGHAKAADVLGIIDRIKRAVRDRHGVLLEEEVTVVGDL